MYDAIKNFAKQFSWTPTIENAARLKKADKFIVAGMGGSNLATGLIKVWKPEANIIIHRDYGLPPTSEKTVAERLMIASSYSGGTEETIDAYREAGERGIARACMSVGGNLFEMAQRDETPYIRFPATGIQPRSAIGYSFRALLALMGEKNALTETEALATDLKTEIYEDKGRELAAKFKEYIPVVYTSARNHPIGYIWKITLNETGKIPAFSNVFPELNHNEMTGFSVADANKQLSDRFRFLFLSDQDDHPQITRRMQVLKMLYESRGLKVDFVEMAGTSPVHKIFATIILGFWTAYYTAQQYGLDAEEVPMVEEFKKMIAH
ncbi:MAG: SIS domain-containing protein [Patescibacteria group bacterium]